MPRPRGLAVWYLITLATFVGAANVDRSQPKAPSNPSGPAGRSQQPDRRARVHQCGQHQCVRRVYVQQFGVDDESAPAVQMVDGAADGVSGGVARLVGMGAVVVSPERAAVRLC